MKEGEEALSHLENLMQVPKEKLHCLIKKWTPKWMSLNQMLIQCLWWTR